MSAGREGVQLHAVAESLVSGHVVSVQAPRVKPELSFVDERGKPWLVINWETRTVTKLDERGWDEAAREFWKAVLRVVGQSPPEWRPTPAEAGE